MPNIIVSTTGKSEYRLMSETVSKILLDYTTPTTEVEGLIFNGHKLKSNKTLSNIPNLSDHHNLFLIIRDIKYLPKQIDANEVRRYQNLYDDASEEERHMIEKYVNSPEVLRNTLLEYPPLRADQFALAMLMNFNLLKEFIFKYPIVPGTRSCIFHVFKKGVNKMVSQRGMFQSTSFGIPRMNGIVQGALPVSSANAITPQMLQQALNMLGQPPNHSSSSSFASSAASSMQISVASSDVNLVEAYANQLSQMRDFGFTNDEENIRTLRTCEGNVEEAMELLITLRESEQI